MKKSIYLIGFVILCFLSSAPAYGQDVYKLSMLPRYFPEKIKAMITPLAKYLSEETGLTIRPVLTKDFSEYEKSIDNNEIQIGYQNPLVYVNVDDVHDVVAMAVKGEQGDKFRGIIITRPDSSITDIDQLLHKKIMIVSKTSAGGFLSQKITALEYGIRVEQDTELSVASDNKQENVIISVSIGDVEAGFIRESALHKADQYIVPQSIKVMAPTAWLPNWAFSLSKTLPEGHKQAITEALLKLKSDSQVMKAMGLTQFIAADNYRYDILRSTMNE